MFVVWFATMMYTILTHDRSVMQIVVPIFRAHFAIVTLRWPKYSPISMIAELLVTDQNPEYVWAIQKRFARWMWLFMATLTMIFGVIRYAHGVPIILCSICLLFMRLETSVWLCVWCKIYYFLIDKWYLKAPDHRPACPWWVCEYKPKSKSINNWQ